MNADIKNLLEISDKELIDGKFSKTRNWKNINTFYNKNFLNKKEKFKTITFKEPLTKIIINNKTKMKFRIKRRSNSYSEKNNTLKETFNKISINQKENKNIYFKKIYKNFNKIYKNNLKKQKIDLKFKKEKKNINIKFIKKISKKRKFNSISDIKNLIKFKLHNFDVLKCCN